MLENDTMFKINTLNDIRYVFYCLSLIFVPSLLLIRVAPALPSIVMIVILGLALWRQWIQPDFKRFFNNKAYLASTGIFVYFLLIGLHGDWTPYLWERWRIAVPFAVLPFAFASLPALSSRQYFSIFYVLIILMTLTCIGVGINYALNLKEITDQIGRGKAMPVPIHHIRFSLLTAFAVLVGALLVRRRFYWLYSWERWAIGGMTLFLFGFIHVLSVRSGLVVLYLSLFVVALRYVLVARKYWMLGVVCLAMFTAPVIAYHTLPSFKIKVAYMIYDFGKFKAGEGKTYSDAERITSLQVGMQIGNQYRLAGVGLGSLKQRVTDIYAEKYPNLKPKMPHNQFVFFYAAGGIMGVLAFAWLFFYPLFYQQHYRFGIFTALHVLIFFSFMVENTINTALGTAIYIFFLLLSLNYIGGRRRK